MTLLKYIVGALGIVSLGLIAGGMTLLFLATGSTPKADTKDIKGSNLVKASEQSLDKSKYKLSQLEINDRVVYLYGEINEMSAPYVTEQILKLGESSEPMYIFIDSPGGSVISGAAIVSAIEAAKGPVNTVCIQLCASMAAMIHQYGTNRLMLNRAFLMFHPASGGVEGEVDKSFSRLGTMRRFIGKMEENAAFRSKTSYDDYKRRSGVELWLDAEDAYNDKFTDKIVFIRGSDSEKIFNNPAVAPPSSDRGRVRSNPTLDIYWE